MTRYVSDELRQEVIRRAKHLCEYCLTHEREAYIGCEVDHIISLKHGGATTSDNLAYACLRCNRHKGSDVGSVHWPTSQFVRFFNPRLDRWSAHFRLRGAEIVARTKIGEVTARLFGFNSLKRLKEREVLIEAELYPSSAAREMMNRRQRRK